MSRPKIFIDGDVGTTGLRIREWLEGRRDLERLHLPEDRRKDPAARREMLNRADLVVLCLPDDAAREAVSFIDNPETRVVDASTAHRTADDWTYGLPELAPDQRARIASARRVSNPGCWPQPVILAIHPLVEAGLVRETLPLSVRGVSGYSGGGRSLIAKWEDPAGGLLGLLHDAPYALERVHKHVPEMARYTGLASAPQFMPSVGPFRCGMRVELALHADAIAGAARQGTAKQVWEVLHERYEGEPFVRVAPFEDPPAISERSFDPQALNDSNRLELAVLPNPAGHLFIIGRLDNLGKGACGAAIQNLNLMLGRPETEGLLGWS